MARASEKTNHSVPEILSLTLLGAGTLLFLALISYSPSDVPSWFPLSTVAGSRGPVLNFIGRLGAIVACCSYTFLGAASYLVAALLLGYGGAKLLNPALRLTRRAFWAAGFVISGACIAHYWPSIIDLDRLGIAGAGGWMGKFFGQTILKTVLGSVGSVIVLILLYASSLIMMTGIHPVAAARELAALPSFWREKWHARKMADADEQQRLALEAERLDRQRRKLEKTLSKRAVTPQSPASTGPEPAPEAAPADAFTLTAEGEAPRPAPQIIDSALPPAPKKKEVKKDKFQPLTSLSCENYELPSLSLLDPIDETERQAADPQELLNIQDTIIETLAQFGIVVSRGDITRGRRSPDTRCIRRRACAWIRS